jgi:hypothetical protein
MDNQLYAVSGDEEIRMKVKKPSVKPKIQHGMPSVEIEYLSERSRDRDF